MVLPPAEVSVSETPHTGGTVYKAYAHGLMFGSRVPILYGGSVLCLSILYLYAKAGVPDTGFLLFSILIFFPLGIVATLLGLIGYRFEQSVLFNRAEGKVHIFSRPCKTAATRMNPRFFTDSGTPDPSGIVIGSIDF
jgi:hypothetical protein